MIIFGSRLLPVQSQLMVGMVRIITSTHGTVYNTNMVKNIAPIWEANHGITHLAKTIGNIC
jgi:hypothetical protein